jgi:hypothetical protein
MGIFINLRQVSDLMICLNQKQHDEMPGTILRPSIASHSDTFPLNKPASDV